MIGQSVGGLGVGIVRRGFECLEGEVRVVMVCRHGSGFVSGMESGMADSLCMAVCRKLLCFDGYVGLVVGRVFVHGSCLVRDVYALVSSVFGGWEDGIEFQDGVGRSEESCVVRDQLRSCMRRCVGLGTVVPYQESCICLRPGGRVGDIVRRGGYVRA